MAFCPLCGKQIPENGICSCGKKLDENGNIVSNAVGQPVAVNGVKTENNQGMRPVQQAPQGQQPQQVRPMQQGQQPQQVRPMQQAPQGQQPQQARPMQQQGQPMQQPQYPQGQQPMYQQGQQPGYPQGQPMYQQGQPMYQPGQYPNQPMPGMQAPRPPKAPSGPNPFGIAFKTFASYFTNPAETSKGIFEGKIPVAAGLILGGLYLIVLMLSLTLFSFGAYGRYRFLRAWGFGTLAATLIAGVKCGVAALIMVFSKNKSVNFVKILSALCVDTVLVDCIVVFAGLLGIGTAKFAMFFLLIAIALVFYYNGKTLKYLAGDYGKSSPNKMFWFNGVLIASNAFIYWISFILILYSGSFF